MANVKRVLPAEARELMNDGYIYVDVRSEPEFEAGHPAGAVNVPVARMGEAGMAPNPAFVEVMERAFRKDAKLVIGCQSEGRAVRASELLAARGFANLTVQRAGFGGTRTPFGAVAEAGWEKAGLPVERGAPPGRSYGDVLAGRDPLR